MYNCFFVWEDKYIVYKKYIKGIIIYGKESNLKEINLEVDKRISMLVYFIDFILIYVWVIGKIM